MKPSARTSHLIISWPLSDYCLPPSQDSSQQKFFNVGPLPHEENSALTNRTQVFANVTNHSESDTDTDMRGTVMYILRLCGTGPLPKS